MYFGVGRETILQWIAKRGKPAYKIGKLWKFKLSEVDDWIRSEGVADDKVDDKDDQSEERVRFFGQHFSYTYIG